MANVGGNALTYMDGTHIQNTGGEGTSKFGAWNFSQQMDICYFEEPKLEQWRNKLYGLQR